MVEPCLKALAMRICCPKRSERAECGGSCAFAEETYFAAATALRDLYRQASGKPEGNPL